MKVENSENQIPEPEITEPKEIKKPQKRLWRFFSHPIWIPIGILVGILTSYYFFEIGKVYPQLVFYVSPVKATIVKAGQASEVKTFYRDKEINTDVTVAQVAIWNQGNASIKNQQILKPVVLFTDNNAPILEAIIKKSTREVIRLNLTQDEFQKGRLPVSWNILEQNDGGVIQIIYAGDSQTDINIEGIIEGQKEILRSAPRETIKSPDEQYAEARDSRNVWFLYIAIPMFILMGIGSLFFIAGEIEGILSSQEGKRKYIESFVLILLGILIIVFDFKFASFFYSVLQAEKLTVPFSLN